MDGYLLQHVDTQLRTALYTWVRAGDPAQVADHLARRPRGATKPSKGA
ncbi:hypothetical protein [Kitasatospora sp. NPDC057223]